MKKKKNRMKKKYKFFLFLILIFIIVIVGIFLLPNFFKKTKEEIPVKVIDSIEDFSYTLEDRDTPLMKDVYQELKEVLKQENVDKKSYAQCLAKLFIIDLFTMENKRNKYDVGGVEFVYPDAQENFKLNVEDTLYKTLKINTDGKRKQQLPVVKSVDVQDVVSEEYILDEKKLEAYKVQISWSYEKELGYDTNAEVTCVVSSDKVYVVEYKTGEEEN